MSSPLQVAVFPLPKIVAFPGHSLQFHIFEPRYRKMVRDCEERGLWLGVAQGELARKGRTGQTLEEFLSSNQETYTPVHVFGAGPMRVLKELPDGRYVIEVEIVQRVRVNERLQELPYTVVEVEPLEDLPVDLREERQLMLELKQEIAQIATLRTGLLKHLHSREYFDDSSLANFVYGILKWFVIENREGQIILEDDDPVSRAKRLLGWMRYFVKEATAAARQETAPGDRAGGMRRRKDDHPDEERVGRRYGARAGDEPGSDRRGPGGLHVADDDDDTMVDESDSHVVHVDFRHRNAPPAEPLN